MAGRPVVIIGEMYDPTLSIGGGPMPGGRPPYVDIGFPMPQPPWPSQPPSWSPVHPSHPIANPWPPYVDAGPPGPQPGQPPLGIWGPPQMPPGYWGGGMGPGVKPQPPAGAHPEHPIYIPAPPTSPPGSPPIAVQLPVFPWTPSHPIVLPPEVTPPPVEGQPPIEWKVAWTPTTGWIVVGVPSGAHPAPSGAAPAAAKK
jgi:hypothetical protein